jgi:hypothetical protein
MNFVRLYYKKYYYSYRDSSNIEMNILGLFFSNVGCDGRTFFKDWALAGQDGDTCGGNCTILEIENDDVLLSDEYSIEAVPTKLRMTRAQFVQLFDEWQEYVCKTQPKEVVIKHEHGHFFIETSDLKWENQ